MPISRHADFRGHSGSLALCTRSARFLRSCVIGGPGSPGRNLMERYAFWIFVAFGLAFGGSMEWLKRSAPAPIRALKIEAPSDLVDQGSPTPRSQPEPAASEEAENEAVADTGPAIPSIQDAVKLAEAAAKKDAKKDAKKNAKKKKKEDEAKKDAVIPAYFPPPPPPSSPPTPDSQAAAGAGAIVQATRRVGAPTGSGAGAGAPRNQRTRAEWIRYLLDKPESARVDEFVRAYRERSVDRETFYSVVQEMTRDSRPEIRQLGLGALAGTPSELSFLALAAIQKNASNAEESARAQTYLRAYGTQRNLSLLANVLDSEVDESANLQAMEILKSSASTNLLGPSGRVPVAGGAPVSTGTQTGLSQTQRQSMARQYASFATMLTNLSRAYRSPQLRTAATETASQLRNALAAGGYSA